MRRVMRHGGKELHVLYQPVHSENRFGNAYRAVWKTSTDGVNLLVPFNELTQHGRSQKNRAHEAQKGTSCGPLLMKGKKMNKAQITKIVASWLLYVGLHYANKFIPGPVSTLIGCPEESIFHHMKMAFFSYLMISVVELVITHRQNKPVQPVLYSRLLSLVIYPYLVFFVWMLVPGLFGMMPSLAAEITYSNVILVICLVCTVALETGVERVQFNRLAKIIPIFLFCLSLVQYSVLAFHKPPVDVFGAHVDGEHSGSEHGAGEHGGDDH
jgi:hypothetical protein